MATVQNLLHAAAALGVETGRRDAEILLGHVLGKNRAWLYTWPETEVTESAANTYLELLAARGRAVPVAYLVGEREFWSLALEVNEHTLIPRTETETLVEWALTLPLPTAATVLDLGTGSGAIALALACERPDWQLTGLDASARALEVARRNGKKHGLPVRFLHSDWYSAVAGESFDLLVSNPPYIDPQDPHLLQGDLPFEPIGALVAEAAGLADIDKIIRGARGHLRRGGWLLLEHGFDQGAAVRELLQQQGFDRVETQRDIAGVERVTGAMRHAE